MRLAESLAEKLLKYLTEQCQALNGKESERMVYIFASVLHYAVYASFLRGRWHRCYETLSRYELFFPDLIVCAQYWEAVAICARANIRSNRVESAHVYINRIPAQFRTPTSQVSSAVTALLSFESQRFKVDPKAPRVERTAAILKNNLTDQIRLMGELYAHESTRTLPEKQRGKRLATLRQLIEQLHAMKNAYDTPRDPTETNQWVNEGMFEFQETMRVFQSPGSVSEEINFDSIERLIHSTALIERLPKWDMERQDNFLERLRDGQHWAESHGDQHGNWLLLWSRFLALDELGKFCERNKILRQLFQSIQQSRAEHEDIQTKSNLANFLPGLAARAYECRTQLDDNGFVADCGELSKSRSLIACRADTEDTLTLSTAGPNALGFNVHYLWLLCFRALRSHSHCLIFGRRAAFR